MIVPGNLDQAEIESRLARMNAVTPVSSKLFSIP